MEDIKYLIVDGVIVEQGTEADLVNTSIQYDSDYEILEASELSQEDLDEWNLRFEAGQKPE